MRSHRPALDLFARASASHLKSQCRCESTGVSAARLEEFVKAEAHYFAQQRWQQGWEPMTLPQLVSHSSDESALQAVLQRELPIRFASRISHITKVQQWERIPELKELQEMHTTSFRELRLVEVQGHDILQEVVQNVRQRHKRIVPLFAKAVSTMHTILPELSIDNKSMDFQALDAWVDSFLVSRISAEVMMTHYMAIHQKEESGYGILDKNCDPYEVCVAAAEKTLKIAGSHSSSQDASATCAINVKEPRKPIILCHTPRYLFYILSELLANSVEATRKHCQASKDPIESRPIELTVCADKNDLVIRICDQGGGFATGKESEQNRFSYSFNINQRTQDIGSDEDSKQPLSQLGELPRPEVDAEARLMHWADEYNPLNGKGIGLPICRMYVQYLGGTLEAMNMPGEGVDAYIKLKRIEDWMPK